MLSPSSAYVDDVMTAWASACPVDEQIPAAQAQLIAELEHQPVTQRHRGAGHVVPTLDQYPASGYPRRFGQAGAPQVDELGLGSRRQAEPVAVVQLRRRRVPASWDVGRIEARRVVAVVRFRQRGEVNAVALVWIQVVTDEAGRPVLVPPSTQAVRQVDDGAGQVQRREQRRSGQRSIRPGLIRRSGQSVGQVRRRATAKPEQGAAFARPLRRQHASQRPGSVVRVAPQTQGHRFTIPTGAQPTAKRTRSGRLRRAGSIPELRSRARA